MMQINSITVNNFKSLIEFQLDLAKFTCLIGLNGSGKSTVLQFIDFLAQQVQGDIKGWLSKRNWRAKGMKSQLTKKNNIDFTVHLTDHSGQQAIWEASFNPVQRHCTHERIEVGDANLSVSGGSVDIGKRHPSSCSVAKAQLTSAYARETPQHARRSNTIMGR